MLAWRLPHPEPALRDSREAVEMAIVRLEHESDDQASLEGWGFRLSAFEVVNIHSRNEKLCLLGRLLEVSTSLHDANGAAEPNPLTSKAPGAAAANSTTITCGSGALAQRTLEVVCVEILVAIERIPGADRRRPVLENWATSRLGCPQGLSPLPALPTSATPAKTTSAATLWERPV